MGVYSGSALLGESVETMNPRGHVLDTLIESAQNEMNMFNAVINLDFMEAYNESGMISLSEADSDDAKENAQKNIGKKIKEFFKKVIAKIKEFVATFVAKVSNLLRNDAKLYKEYQENFKKNGVGYKVTKYHPMLRVDQVWSAVQERFLKPVVILGDIGEKMTAVTTREELDKLVDKASILTKGGNIKRQAASKSNRASKIEDMFFTGDPVEDYKLTETDIAIVDNIMANGGKKIIGTIKNLGKRTEADIKSAQNDMKLDRPAAKADEDELAIAKWNAQYKLAGKIGNYTSNYISQTCNVAARYVASARRTFIVVGKNATAKKVQESYGMDIELYDEILGEASDYYVEKSLQMA